MEKWALITGASGGIGAAIAQVLAPEYNLYLHYNSNEKSISDLKERLQTNVIAIQANLEEKNGVSNLTKQIDHEPDCIIYNSGHSYVGLMTDMTSDEVERMIQLHVTSPFLLIKELLPNMVRKKQGAIVLITSVWGLTGASCEVLYSMVKGGQNTFVKALAKEVAPSGIRVNGVAPGIIKTSMLDHFSVEDLKEIALDIPMGRLGNPIEIANTVEFLLSKKASYINGEIISVNGAWHT